MLLLGFGFGFIYVGRYSNMLVRFRLSSFGWTGRSGSGRFFGRSVSVVFCGFGGFLIFCFLEEFLVISSVFLVLISVYLGLISFLVTVFEGINGITEGSIMGFGLGFFFMGMFLRLILCDMRYSFWNCRSNIFIIWSDSTEIIFRFVLAVDYVKL